MTSLTSEKGEKAQRHTRYGSDAYRKPRLFQTKGKKRMAISQKSLTRWRFSTPPPLNPSSASASLYNFIKRSKLHLLAGQAWAGSSNFHFST